MFDIGLAYALQAMGLNEFHDALEVGSDIGREDIKCSLCFLIEKSDLPWRGMSIPFLQYMNAGKGRRGLAARPIVV